MRIGPAAVLLATLAVACNDGPKYNGEIEIARDYVRQGLRQAPASRKPNASWWSRDAYTQAQPLTSARETWELIIEQRGPGATYPEHRFAGSEADARAYEALLEEGDKIDFVKDDLRSIVLTEQNKLGGVPLGKPLKLVDFKYKPLLDFRTLRPGDVVGYLTAEFAVESTRKQYRFKVRVNNETEAKEIGNRTAVHKMFEVTRSNAPDGYGGSVYPEADFDGVWIHTPASRLAWAPVESYPLSGDRTVDYREGKSTAAGIERPWLPQGQRLERPCPPGIYPCPARPTPRQPAARPPVPPKKPARKQR